MSLCNFSFDSAIDSEATVSIQTPFFPSKDVGLPWNFDLEHLLGKKKGHLLLTGKFSVVENSHNLW